MRLALAPLVLLLHGVWWALVLATPLCGVWLASSLASYLSGPRWAVLAAGLLLFPLGPSAWELLSRARRRSNARPPMLTTGDRLILRTLAINLVFLTAILSVSSFRKSSFAALAARGDWMLDGRHDPRAEQARRALFRVASLAERAYAATRSNPFRDARPAPQPGPTTTPRQPSSQTTPASDRLARDPARETDSGWPFASTLHAAVREMPAEAEGSPDSVGRFLASRERDPLQLVKAVHDYVADRIAYDAAAYLSRSYPPQDAASVLQNRRGVCAGYAHLFEAIARAAGLEAVYLVGDARTGRARDLEGEGHAWNAVQVRDHWYLLDTTWDAGHLEGSAFVKRYRTAYLMPPPAVMGVTHYPEDPRWQLRASPIDRGTFLRQPSLTPAFFAQGLELRSPDRSQVETSGALTLRVANPRAHTLQAEWRVAGNTAGQTLCERSREPDATLTCALPGPGRYDVLLFAGAPTETLDWAGTLEVVRR